ncbi:Cryptochrome DASH [Porphyridium purpureum]|uniref:Cryptochrome DASH n=1 Tax=Porphyridium purpureum TaxID=35688 RepID=A0A5J4YSW0_PORPP|nr:Cryptochrome DASH [Porphyridium purpureum]|eukprot:POR1133..scf236_6
MNVSMQACSKIVNRARLDSKRWIPTRALCSEGEPRGLEREQRKLRVAVTRMKELRGFNAPKRVVTPPSEDSYVIAWFRADLRLCDNPMLAEAIHTGKGRVLPVYCFDSRNFGLTDEAKLPKCAAPRAQFLRECVQDLRNSLQEYGSDLIVRHGRTEVILARLAKQYQCSHIIGSKQVAWDELRIESKLRSLVTQMEIPPKVSFCCGAETLYHLEDLPREFYHVPDDIPQFRRSVEAQHHRPGTRIRLPFLPPDEGALLPLPEDIDRGTVPSLDDLLQESIPDESQRRVEPDARAPYVFRGGETAALEHAQSFFWETDGVSKYNYTRKGMTMRGTPLSSMLSVWLAQGCISARSLYHVMQSYERERVANSTQWLFRDLIRRDYYRLLALRLHHELRFQRDYVKTYFQDGPRVPGQLTWKRDREAFEKWCMGKTGFPLVDACMRELYTTGFLSGRGRMSVASFLTRDLLIDWRWGAEWFQSRLVDYDSHSNYGNWVDIAGVGMDQQRQEPYVNVVNQAKSYDENGDYVKHWLPELSKIPVEHIHEPYKIPAYERNAYKCLADYPEPVIDSYGRGGFLTKLGKDRDIRPFAVVRRAEKE